MLPRRTRSRRSNVFGETVPTQFGQTVGIGQELLLESTLCFGLGTSEIRRENRASIGVLVAEDMVERSDNTPSDNYYDRARKGAWYEFIGDFHVVADLGDPAYWYDQAETIYRENADPAVSLAEQEHLALFTFYRVVLRGVGESVDEVMPREWTLTDWIALKRSNFSDHVTALETSDPEW